MYHAGELAGFRLGKLIRIPANEVERYECQTITPSHGTETNGASLSAMKAEGDYASRLVRQSVDLPSLAPVKSGRDETQRKANG
jgi:hypothetical protein